MHHFSKGTHAQKLGHISIMRCETSVFLARLALRDSIPGCESRTTRFQTDSEAHRCPAWIFTHSQTASIGRDATSITVTGTAGRGETNSTRSARTPLSTETNWESEIGFSSSIPRSAPPLSTPEAESGQIALDSKPSLEDLSFSSGASTYKPHCATIHETDWLQTYDTTSDRNAETACDL